MPDCSIPDSGLPDSGLPLPFQDMLQRMMAKDSAADGLFITGVLTTGIYCLPSCPARKPKAENVKFFANEAEARAAGLRACKRCRPDHFYAGRDADHELLQSALAALEHDPSAFPDVATIAAHMGIRPSKLYALTRRFTGSTPAELMHGKRIDAAQRLLAGGEVGATEAAFAVGYSSVSAFYQRFCKATGLTPGQFARRHRSGVPENASQTLGNIEQ